MNIGITGHQNLGDRQTEIWINDKLESEIHNLSIGMGFSCLAVGADQVFTSVLVEHNIPFTAIIPCYDYEATFNEKTIDLYKTLLSKATNQIHLNYIKPSEEAFYNASKLMVDKCEVIMAIWNGLPAKGLGGTADVVNYAKAAKKKVIHLNPIDKTIKHI